MLRFESLNHANPDAFNTELAFPTPANRTHRARRDSDAIDAKRTIPVCVSRVVRMTYSTGDPKISCNVYLVMSAGADCFPLFGIFTKNICPVSDIALNLCV
jgi:hypothetical protein